jgi:branched-chain amino acid aminotransferase
VKVSIDGKYFDRDDARVSVFDHGLLYGDGVFEGIRVYAGGAFKLKEHVKRLFDSARAILLEMPMTEEEMEAAVLDAVRVNGLEDGYIRLVVTRGEGDLGLDPASCGKPRVIIIAGGIQVYPEEFYEKGIAVVTASSRRAAPDALDPRIKSLNYLNNVLAKIEASSAGALEAVMLNAQGFVAECTADNIFIVKNGALLTPPPFHGALDGITMGTVLELAVGIGIGNGQRPLTRYDLYTADECFLTGTGAEIMPVVSIDGRAVGDGKPGPVTGRLMEEFRKYVSVTSRA